MKLRKYLNELILKKNKRSELRDIIINALEPGALRLNKALKKHKGHEKLALDVRDAKILMDGLNKVLKFLDKIEIEK
jgi:hypothetical protein